MTDDTQKRCPDCAEFVQADVRICRHCRYDFETGISGDGSRRQTPQPPATQPTAPQSQAAPAMHPPAMHPPAQHSATAPRPRKRRRLTRRGWIVLGIIVAVVVIAAIAGSHKSSSSPSSPAASSAVSSNSSSSAGPSDSGSSASSSPAPSSGGAHVFVVASKSFCTYTGVDDAYTGNGHVEFFLTLKNSGDEDGKISIIPVRHYTDGGLNESALDEVEVTVPAGQLWRGHTPAYKYKAHEHEIASCGLLVNGNFDNEISINATGL